MFINGSGAKPMDAFCSFPKQLPSRAEVLLSFSVVGLCSACAWSIAMPSFPTVRGVRYGSCVISVGAPLWDCQKRQICPFPLRQVHMSVS